MCQLLTVTAASKQGVFFEAMQQLQLCIVAHLKEISVSKAKVAVLLAWLMQAS
jgi:hypothetical protein